MVEFVRLQQIIQDQFKQDKTIRTIEVEGVAVEDAVAEAAALLGIPVRRLEYEIIERGFSGFFGVGQRNWKISAYERYKAVEKKDAVEYEGGDIDHPKLVLENKDGEVFVHFDKEGVFLKVTPPLGTGKKAVKDHAFKVLAARKATDIDHHQVNAVVKQAGGEYTLVGRFVHNSMEDASVSVSISEDEMKAFVYVNPPGPSGCDISLETLVNVLRRNRVVSGINTDFLQEFADKPVYKEKILAAEGSHPVNGRDSYLRYNFETESNRVHIQEGADGRINFKELNIIQNVVKGQPLAKKAPAEKGTPGKTVTGKTLPAKSGKDLPVSLGANVSIADDGVTIIADMNGQVVLTSGKINVEPVFVVPGNVDIKTGNIIFLGNVIIKGNVEDGFSVKAAGNIEVNGAVERAELDAEGDIIVHQGITGKSTGRIKAGRSLWARFIENARIEAGDMVVVSDGIINSFVDANKRVICEGKRAHIVGGRIRAMEEINAKVLGSPLSGTETICEVGFDPKSKEQLDIYTLQKNFLTKELEKTQRNLQTLIQKKQDQSLPEDKEAYLQELTDKCNDLTGELASIEKETMKLKEFLNNLTNRSKISVSSKVYPGVRITIRDATENVRNGYQAVTFILEESGFIGITKYEDPKTGAKGGFSGGSAY
ncbi:MAG: FapA family protein [Spirochaetaceae bacterium]|jgi:uncharacterized protein (DUF342 family)|nr:FapA family protein [Spirochaetaceae bacterium]